MGPTHSRNLRSPPGRGAHSGQRASASSPRGDPVSGQQPAGTARGCCPAWPFSAWDTAARQWLGGARGPGVSPRTGVGVSSSGLAEAVSVPTRGAH